jgi:hypothetical protein
LVARYGMAFRFLRRCWRCFRRSFYARKGGRLEIEKRAYVWRFLALKVPFGNLKFPNRCPVAGTDGARSKSLNQRSLMLRCRAATRVAGKCPAGHTLLSV